ncbi:MAG: hypothetical protein IPM57_07550 [Oligoflexia bacterium]|nr:hypothetical protein [Oligoflexia bacterium]
MRILLILLTLSLVPAASFAQKGKGGKVSLKAYYGYASVSPANVNTNHSQYTAPRPGDITSHQYYGGGLGFMLGQKFEVAAQYEMYEAKNNASNGNGITIDMDMAWLDFNYYFVRSAWYVYLGAGAGMTVSSSFPRKQTTTVTYSADNNIAFEGQLGFGRMLGNHFSLFLEAAYKSITTGDLKSGSTFLTNTGNQRVKVDMSGLYASAGLGIHF